MREKTTRDQLKVLLVDDDAFQLDLITEVLRSMGIRDISSASSAAQGLQKLQGAAIDVVLLDLHMPGQDGFGWMEEAARQGYAGALIIVSGQSEDVLHAASLVARLRRFTVLGAVTKPVERAALLSLINGLCSG